MVVGKYYAFRRTKELGLTTSFTYNIQVLLAIFGFSVVAIGFLFTAIGRLSMLDWLPTWLFTFSSGVLIALIVAFVTMIIYTIYKIVQLGVDSQGK